MKKVLAVITLLLAGAVFAQTTVTLWHMEEPPYRVQRFQELIDEFNAQHPDIVVEQAVQNWGDVIPKALNAARANALPEILFTLPDFTVVMRNTGAIQPVTEFASRLDDEHGFLDSAITPYKQDGETWAVPMWGMIQNLWYRQDVFEAAGVEVPETWDELLTAVEALSTNGKGGIGLPASHSLYTDQVIYNFMITAGASELFDDQCNITFDTPQTVQAFDYYKQLYQYSPADSTSWIWGDAEANFAAGAVAIIPQFTVITTYATQTDGAASNLGVMSFPVGAGGEPGGIYYSNAAMITTTDPAKKAAAEEFLAYLLEPATYGRFLNMEPGLFLPATADGQESDTFWSDDLVVAYRSQVEHMMASSANGKLFGFTSPTLCQAIGPISAQNLLSDVVQRMLVKGDSAADAVKWGQQQMEAAQ